MEKQKKRNEINNKYKWDLTPIFKTDKEWLDNFTEKHIDKLLINN